MRYLSASCIHLWITHLVCSPSVTPCPSGTVWGLSMNFLLSPSSSFSKGIRRKEHFINPTAYPQSFPLLKAVSHDRVSFEKVSKQYPTFQLKSTLLILSAQRSKLLNSNNNQLWPHKSPPWGGLCLPPAWDETRLLPWAIIILQNY